MTTITYVTNAMGEPMTTAATKHRIISTATFAIIAIVMALMLAFAVTPNRAYAEVDAPSNCGKLAVKGGNLVSAKTGKTVVLRGVSTHGLAWYPQYVNNSCFKTLRTEWNVNCIRLAMYTAEFGYCDGYSKKKLEKRIANGVKYAIANDMYVIIDWHILSDGNPNTYLKQAKKFFKKMAKKYGKKSNVIFEICNEPNGRGTWKNIKKYAKKIIPIIRKKAKNSIILVGTPAWCTRVDKAASSPLPKRYRKNVMYTAHFYANSHQELARRLVVKAKKKKTPVFVSEYGISSDTGNHGINVEQANLWMELLDKYNISSCAWSLCNKNESSAFIKPSYKKAYGFTYANLTASGKWLYDMLGNAYAEEPVNDETPATDDMAPFDDNEAGDSPTFTPAS